MALQHLVIMAKAPRLGQVKTRLGRGIGAVTATSFYRTNLAVTVRRLAFDPRWHTRLAIAPDVEMQAAFWPRGVARTRQGRGDLGQRMARLLGQQPGGRPRERPAGHVVLIGSDIPGVMPAMIARAFHLLGDCDVVLGPANDGGYWLIGCRGGGRPLPADVFAAVRWSSRYALGDTRAALEGRGWRVACCGVLSDIDTAEDYARLRRGGVVFGGMGDSEAKPLVGDSTTR